MKGFKNILAIYNQAPGDESTLRRATSLAQRHGARLTVVEVIDIPGLPNTSLPERQAHLERLVASIRYQGIEVNAEVVSGVPAIAIIQAVLRGKHDLVLMTAEARSEWKARFLGGTSMDLMRKCPCPVWITDLNHKSENYSRVLASVDTSTPGKENAAINMKIMELAILLARMDGGDLHVTHAWELNKDDKATAESEITPKTEFIVERLIERGREEHQVGVDALLSKYNLEDLRCQVHMPRGRAGTMIPQLAATAQRTSIWRKSLQIPTFVYSRPCC